MLEKRMSATILVIDDDPALVNMLKEDLLAEGYHVLEGYDGDSAFQIAQASLPQLLIMDVNMPGLTGPEALTLLRGSESTRDIPILFLTGDSTRSADAAQDARLKVTRMEKPVDFDVFNTLVRKLVAAPR